MKKKSTYDIEVFRRTATWAEEIVAKDQVYQDYAGAPMDIGDSLASIDICLKYLINDENMRTLIKLYRAYLIQKKKAFFAGILANQITMLAFLKGGRIQTIDAIINPEHQHSTDESDPTHIQ